MQPGSFLILQYNTYRLSNRGVTGQCGSLPLIFLDKKFGFCWRFTTEILVSSCNNDFFSKMNTVLSTVPTSSGVPGSSLEYWYSSPPRRGVIIVLQYLMMLSTTRVVDYSAKTKK